MTIGLALTAGAATALTGLAGAATGSRASTTRRNAAVSPPRAQLEGFVCQKALDPPSRAVGVESVMRPVTGTARMAIRFDLLEHPAGSTTPRSVVRAGDLGVWLTPKNPTLGQLPGDVWQLDKDVYDLDAPADYRFRVTFRWTGASGQVVATTVRQSAICHQPELRPDLIVESIAVIPVPQHPEHDQYVALITDHGATGAGPFVVQFTPGGGLPAIQHTVTYLKAQHSRTETFVGPVCNPAGPPTVTADATDQVDELTRANSTLAATCPPVTTTTTTTITPTTPAPTTTTATTPATSATTPATTATTAATSPTTPATTAATTATTPAGSTGPAATRRRRA
ncbi:MAG: hypothetical protein ABSH51_25995 [Solirubrobacteraceae bacterium]